MFYILLCFVFFFASRRRHTRWPRDWSSDVCSSDLNSARSAKYCKSSLLTAGFSSNRFPIKISIITTVFSGVAPRSEERRVGKESRVGWPAESELMYRNWYECVIKYYDDVYHCLPAY